MITLLEEVFDTNLLKKNGEEFEEITDLESKLKGVEVIAYYFGAKWCSECVKFTPVLKEFYNKMKEKNESFEIIYVSSDKNEEEMKEFVLDSHGDWYILRVDENDEAGKEFDFIWYIRRSLHVKGIPKLVITKENNFFIASSNGLTEVLTKGEAAFDEWKNKVEEDSEDTDEEETSLEGDIKPNCCKISKFKPWVSIPPTELLSGMTLLRKIGNEFTEESADDVLGDVEIMAFFFSADWRMGLCDTFTTELKKVYEELKSENKSFEVIFVSDDETDDAEKQYMLDLHGDWYAIPSEYEKFKRSLKKKFHVEGIPTLGIVSKRGYWITADGVDDISSKGAEAFDSWAKIEEQETTGNAEES